MFKIILNKNKSICCAYRCSNNRAKRDRFCHKHRKRFHKENDFAAYTYNALKSNAKRRKKIFTLTLNEFKDFCEKNNYLQLKGKSASSASIDCIIAKKGYTKDNIQILSLSKNSSKGNRDQNFEDCPF